MADIEKAISELQEYHDREWTEERDFPATRETRKRVTGNALELLTEYKELKSRHAIIVKAADDMYAELKERGWIPVIERLPKDESDILVYCDDGEVSRIVPCNYDNGVWFDCVSNTVMEFKNITHWMPLPEPPKVD